MIMRNLKTLVCVGGVSAVVGLSGLVTGCSTWGEPKDGRTAGQVTDDKHITERVETTLRGEPVYKFENVDVKTYQGVVQLSGFVRTDDQKQRAGEIAQNTPGVGRVLNSISLLPEPAPTPTGRMHTDNPDKLNPTTPTYPSNPNNPPPQQ